MITDQCKSLYMYGVCRTAVTQTTKCNMRIVRFPDRRKLCGMIAMIAVFGLISLFVSREQIAYKLEVFEDPMIPIRGLAPLQGASISKKNILLLSYQRCGSSFMGQLFNYNAKAFYIFEPGDSVYASMYGTKMGWAVPSDITHHWNGKPRAIPLSEVLNMAELLNNLYHCRMDKIPTEFYLHLYWMKFPKSVRRLHPYAVCTMTSFNKLQSCRRRYLGGTCPARFGENESKQEQCQYGLQQALQKVQYPGNNTVLDSNNTFEQYQNCQSRERKRIIRCINVMRAVCRRSVMFATKTVRTRMDTVEALLRSNSNLKVIHLIRDPRAVVLSRTQSASFRSHFSQDDMVKEATLFCEDVLKDLEKRHSLQEEYPGAFHEIIYENFVSNPYENARRVYNFIGLPLPFSVIRFLRLTSRKENSVKIANRWRKTLPKNASEEILSQCKKLYKTVNFSRNT